MGKEAKCLAVINGKSVELRASLEETGMKLRGDKKVDCQLSQIQDLRVENDWLHFVVGDYEVRLNLGVKPALSWAKYIQSPPTLLDKLGLKKTPRIALLGSGDFSDLSEVESDFSLIEGVLYDAIIVFVQHSHGLRSLRQLLPSIAQKGMLWIVYPKGVSDIRQAGVLAAGRSLGLADVKVCRYSESHTALKFVRRQD